MSIVESIESGVLPIELREALRTLLSQHNQPYLDIPSTDGLGLCISTCFADFRRHVEAEYQVKLGSQLKVPANYTINGRRRLPDSGGRLKYQDAGTQTEPGTAMYTATQSQLRSETPTATAQIESAPEARRRRGKGGRIPVICSSSSDTDRVVNPRSSQQSHARPRQASIRATSVTSSPCAWERAIRQPVGPIYGPEDLVSGWVSKKRKASSSLHRPPKRPVRDAGSRLDISDADDEDDVGLESDENNAASVPPPATASPPSNDLTSTAGVLRSTTSADDVPTDTVTEPVVSSVEGVEEGVPATEVASIPVVPSSQDSSPHGSDSQNLPTELEKEARAALHKLESATSTRVSQKHRGAMIEHSLALGKRDTLENFRQACSYWRRPHMPNISQTLALEGPARAQGSADLYSQSDMRHPALQQFSRAYHNAQATIVHRAVLDILYRADLAYLHDVYRETLEALSRSVVQDKPPSGSRPRDVFDDDVRNAAYDQMYWACYPDQQGKPRSCNTSLARKFRRTLDHAEKWHTMREELGIGMLALVPRGANSWFEKLPFKDVPVYLRLVIAVNPVAIDLGGMITERVFALCRRQQPPERLLRLEHLETIDEISFKDNPSKLLEEINVGYTTRSSRVPERPPTGRAVTVPADSDISDAVLEDILSGIDHHGLGSGPAGLSFGYSPGIGDSRLLPRPARMSEEGYEHSTLVRLF